ncbi:ABCF1 protein, partial [Toxostoma redivivum]|nr:ABCF1 protein [Toxostoma redivivum]
GGNVFAALNQELSEEEEEEEEEKGKKTSKGKSAKEEEEGEKKKKNRKNEKPKGKKQVKNFGAVSSFLGNFPIFWGSQISQILGEFFHFSPQNPQGKSPSDDEAEGSEEAQNKKGRVPIVGVSLFCPRPQAEFERQVASLRAAAASGDSDFAVSQAELSSRQAMLENASDIKV